jgi:Fe-S-cluster containining protein
MAINFPCTKCGLCCRMLDHIPMLAKYNNGHGICIYLRDNLCTIYTKRPDACNINTMYFSYFKNMMSEKEFIVFNLKACLELKKLSKQ